MFQRVYGSHEVHTPDLYLIPYMLRDSEPYTLCFKYLWRQVKFHPVYKPLPPYHAAFISGNLICYTESSKGKSGAAHTFCADGFQDLSVFYCRHPGEVVDLCGFHHCGQSFYVQRFHKPSPAPVQIDCSRVGLAHCPEPIH